MCLYEGVTIETVSYFNVHSSTCHTRKHGSITFNFISSLLDTNGPNISLKGGASASQCTRRSAIFCSPGLPLSLGHFTDLNKKLLTAALPLVIQYPELLSSFKVVPLLPWAHFMWHSCMIRFDTFSSFSKMIRCLFSSFKNDLLSRPPTHIIPLLFNNWSNCLIVELLGIVASLFRLFNALRSAGNLFSWTNLINWASLS